MTKCIQKLKTAKGDGNIGFDSDHQINDSHKLHVILCLLINIMISHGYTTKELVFATIISIPKNLKDLSAPAKIIGEFLCPQLFVR